MKPKLKPTPVYLVLGEIPNDFLADEDTQGAKDALKRGDGDLKKYKFNSQVEVDAFWLGINEATGYDQVSLVTKAAFKELGGKP